MQMDANAGHDSVEDALTALRVGIVMEVACMPKAVCAVLWVAGAAW